MLVCILHSSIITIINIYAKLLRCPRFKPWKGEKTQKNSTFVLRCLEDLGCSVHTSAIKSSKISVDLHLIKEK